MHVVFRHVRANRVPHCTPADLVQHIRHKHKKRLLSFCFLSSRSTPSNAQSLSHRIYSKQLYTYSSSYVRLRQVGILPLLTTCSQSNYNVEHVSLNSTLQNNQERLYVPAKQLGEPFTAIYEGHLANDDADNMSGEH